MCEPCVRLQSKGFKNIEAVAGVGGSLQQGGLGSGLEVISHQRLAVEV